VLVVSGMFVPMNAPNHHQQHCTEIPYNIHTGLTAIQMTLLLFLFVGRYVCLGDPLLPRSEGKPIQWWVCTPMLHIRISKWNCRSLSCLKRVITSSTDESSRGAGAKMRPTTQHSALVVCTNYYCISLYTFSNV
jgi:hypothetical protein